MALPPPLPADYLVAKSVSAGATPPPLPPSITPPPLPASWMDLELPASDSTPPSPTLPPPLPVDYRKSVSAGAIPPPLPSSLPLTPPPLPSSSPRMSLDPTFCNFPPPPPLLLDVRDRKHGPVCPPLAAPKVVTQKQGAVLKRSKTGIGKSWKDRCMEVNAKGECKVGDSKFLLKGATVTELSLTDDAFYLTIQEEGKKTIDSCLQVRSETDYVEWLAVFFFHGCKVVRLLARGFLIKCDSSGTKWAERWFSLYEDSLRYFKKRGDNKPTGSIPIGGHTEFAAGPGLRFSVSENGDMGTRVLKCEAQGEAGHKHWVSTLKAIVASKVVKKFPDSLLEGYLIKANKDKKFWKKRYFVLLPDKMLYYTKRSDDSATGEIQLPGGSEAETLPDTLDHKHQFQVAENGDELGTRKYFIKAKSERERRDWVLALHKLFATKNSCVHPFSLKEGYLWKQSSNMALGGPKGVGKSWNKRYFILTKDALLYHKKKHDSMPKGNIDLTKGAEVLSSEADVLKDVPPSQFTVAENGDEAGTRKFFIYAADNTTRRDWIEAFDLLLSTKDTRRDPNSIKEGYLWKANPSGRSYNKRYFVLTKDKLAYFKKKDDENIAGEIPLPGGAEVDRVEAELDASEGHNWAFSVAENGDEAGTRTYLLSAATSKARTAWVKVLMKLITSKESKVMNLSLMEGYLWKCPENGGSFRKRYFILVDNKLLYYKKRMDTNEAGSVDIGGEAEVEVFDEGLRLMFSVAKNGDETERKLVMYATNALDRNRWITGLSSVSASQTTKVDPNSVREGYLHVKIGSVWRKRFCILLPKSLTYYTKRSDSRHTGLIVLDKDVVITTPVINSSDPFKERPSLELANTPLEKKISGGRDIGGRTMPTEEAGSPEDESTLEPSWDIKPSEGQEGIEDGDWEDAQFPFSIARDGHSKTDQLLLSAKNESERNQWMWDIMLILLRNEFPRSDSTSIKSGYLQALFKRGVLSQASGRKDKWSSGHVVLKPTKLEVYKNVKDDLPAQVVTVDGDTSIAAVTVAGTGKVAMMVGDSMERELYLAASTNRALASWKDTLTKAIRSRKSGQVPSKPCKMLRSKIKDMVAISGHYFLPEVLVACITYLRSLKHSYCLFKTSGEYHIVRDHIIDYENGMDVVLFDGASVASLLRIYLSHLAVPVLPEEVAEDVLRINEEGQSSSTDKALRIRGVLEERLLPEHLDVLNLLLYFIRDEIQRPEEVEVTRNNVASIWAPIIMPSEAQPQDRKSSIIVKRNMDLLQSKKNFLFLCLDKLSTLFPDGQCSPRRKLKAAKLAEAQKRCEDLSLVDLRADPIGLALYFRFAKAQFIDENIRFLTAQAAYKARCQAREAGRAECTAEALAICEEYVKQGAERQVNVADSMSKAIIADVKAAQQAQKEMTGEEFDKVASEVELLISTNSFPRFKQSEFFDCWAAVQSEKLAREQDTSTADDKLIQKIRRITMHFGAAAIQEIKRTIDASGNSDRGSRGSLRLDGAPDRMPVLPVLPGLDEDEKDEEDEKSKEAVWFKQRDPSSRKFYYVNTLTLEPVWDKPAGSIFMREKTQEGRPYYIDTTKGESTWEVPPGIRGLVTNHRISLGSNRNSTLGSTTSIASVSVSPRFRNSTVNSSRNSTLGSTSSRSSTS